MTAVVWWGSYIDYEYEACQYQQWPAPVKPDYFLLQIWNDVPAEADLPYSHPNDVIWEYKAYDYDEVLVGYDQSQMYTATAGAGTGFYESTFRYSVRLPQEDWFCQPDVNTVYWLSIVAVWNTEQGWPDYYWGWTNHEHVFNDDGVMGWPDYYDPNSWYWDELIDYETEESQDLSFVLFTEPDECCDCADFNSDGIVNFLD